MFVNFNFSGCILFLQAVLQINEQDCFMEMFDPCIRVLKYLIFSGISFSGLAKKRHSCLVLYLKTRSQLIFQKSL